MKRNNLPKDFLDVLNSVKNKRARFVIDTILEKGVCTTEDLKNAGYEHAPRAARDVREGQRRAQYCGVFFRRLGRSKAPKPISQDGRQNAIDGKAESGINRAIRAEMPFIRRRIPRTPFTA